MDFIKLKEKTNREASERYVIGCILLEQDKLPEVTQFVEVRTFYKTEHQIIFKAILELNEEDKGIDMLTVSSKIKNKGQNDLVSMLYISEICNSVGSTYNLEDHCLILREAFLSRLMLDFSMGIVRRSENNLDALELAEWANNELQDVTSLSVMSKVRDMSDICTTVVKRLEDSKDKDLTGLSTGFSDVDRITGGWQKDNLIILAARPGMGKTALALNFSSWSAIEQKKKTLFFSLEMSSEQLVSRVLVQRAKIDSNSFRRGNLTGEEWARLHEQIKVLENSELKVYDDIFNLAQLKSKCIQEQAKEEIGLIVVDYLQLLEVSGERSREQEISKASRTLKMLSKKCQCPVIALSQLSRKVEERPSKRPQLSDLRESGAIEQDADIVSFIYRPEYYGIEQTEDGHSTSGLGFYDIAKNRAGSLEQIPVKWEGWRTNFSDYNSKAIEPNYDFTDDV